MALKGPRLAARGLAVMVGIVAIGIPVAAQNADSTALPCLIRVSQEIDVAVEVSGRVAEVAVSHGQRVEAGDLLVRQNAKPERAALALAERAAKDTSAIEAARARLDLLDAQQKRMAELIDKELVPQNTYDQLLAEQVTAQEQFQRAKEDRIRAALERDRVQAQLAQRTIHAPVSGIVTELDIAPGELGNPDTPLMRLAVLDPLLVTAFLPIRLHGQLDVGQSLPVEPEAPVGGRFLAEIEVIDRVYDAASGTFGIRMRLDNQNAALPGGIRCKLIVPEVEQ